MLKPKGGSIFPNQNTFSVLIVLCFLTFIITSTALFFRSESDKLLVKKPIQPSAPAAQQNKVDPIPPAPVKEIRQPEQKLPQLVKQTEVDSSFFTVLPSSSINPYKKYAIATILYSDDQQNYASTLSMLFQLLHDPKTKVDSNRLEVAVVVTNYSPFVKTKISNLLALGARVFIVQGKEYENEHFGKLALFKLSCYDRVAFYGTPTLFLSSPASLFDLDIAKKAIGAISESGSFNEDFLVFAPSEDILTNNLTTELAKERGLVNRYLENKLTLQHVDTRYNTLKLATTKTLDDLKKDGVVAIHDNFWKLKKSDFFDEKVNKLWNDQLDAVGSYQRETFGSSDIKVPDSQTVLIFTWIIGAQSNQRYDVSRLIKNRQDYVDLHPGVDFQVVRELTSGATHPVWQKVYDLKAYFDTHEWFWLLDSDALIMNHRLDLYKHIILPTLLRYKDPSKIDILVAKDCNDINAGSILVRRSAWSRGFVDRWLSKEKDKYYQEGMREQQALKDMIDRNEGEIKEHVSIVPLNLINAYARSVCGYQDPDGTELLYHAPGYGFQALSDYIRDKKLEELKPIE